MKKQIRPDLFNKGRRAFEAGLPQTANPYADRFPLVDSDSWILGWNNAAFEEYKKIKRILEFRAEQYPDENLAADWLDLAQKFKMIRAKANFDYCLYSYRRELKRFNQPIPPEYQNIEDIADEPEFDWQIRKDIE